MNNLVALAAAMARQITNTALAALFAIITSRLLAPTDRGLVVIVLTVSQVSAQLGALGINQSARIEASTNSISTVVALTRKYRGPNILASILTAGALMAMGLVGLDPPLIAILIAASCALATLSSWCLIRKDILHGSGRHTTAQMADIVQWTTSLLLLLIVVVVDQHEVLIAVGALIAGSVTQVAYLIHQIRKHSPTNNGFAASSTSDASITLNFRALLSSVGQYAMMRIDKLIIGLVFGPVSIALYSIAATLSELSWMATLLLAQYASRATTQGDRRTVRRTRIANLAITSMWIPLVTLASPLVVPRLFGFAYAESVEFVLPRSIAAAACGILYLELSVLAAQRRKTTAVLISWSASALTATTLTIGTTYFSLVYGVWASSVGLILCAVVARVAARTRSEPTP